MMMPVGAGSPTIFAKNRQSQKPAPAYVLCAINRTKSYIASTIFAIETAGEITNFNSSFFE
jgi:hypothetical protein